MAAPASTKHDQIVHDLDGMHRSSIVQSTTEHRSTRRRSSMAKASLAPIQTDFKEHSTTDDLKVMRRRAARACDQCRRRKSRCDGQRHCSACKVVGLQCSYGHAIKQTRGPSYVAHLEKKVDELEKRLKSTTLPSGNGVVAPRSVSRSPTCNTITTAQCGTTVSDWTGTPVTAPPSSTSDQCGLFSPFQGLPHPPQTGAFLMSVSSEPRGFFGIDILRQLWNRCRTTDSFDSDSSCDVSLKLVQALDAPITVDNLHVDGPPLLPPKAQLIRWISVALKEALPLWPFVDWSTVQMTIYRLYNTDSFGQDANDKYELALLYALLALGQRFDDGKILNAAECKTQGLVFFAAARRVITLQRCDQSLAALQTVLCMALYLKAASEISRAHAFVSAAASAGLRMGLHEQVPYLAEREQVIRRRTWSTVHSLEIMTSSLLGIPHMVTSAAYDDDPFPPLVMGFEEDRLTSSAHFRLIAILGRGIEKTYCSSFAKKPMGLGTLAVPEEGMNEACSELDTWAQSCPALATPIANMRKCQLLLACSQAYVELMLFSPFVHHLANSPGISSIMEYNYAYRAFHAAANAVGIAQVLHKHLWLNEAHAITMDTLAFASVVLLTVERTSAVSQLLVEASQCVKQAKELVLLLSLQNSAAAQIWEALSTSDISTKNESPQSLNSSPFQLNGNALPLHRGILPTRPATLVHQDSGVDFTSPVLGSCVNPSSLLTESEARVEVGADRLELTR